jgi:hypothetical protein
LVFKSGSVTVRADVAEMSFNNPSDSGIGGSRRYNTEFAPFYEV